MANHPHRIALIAAALLQTALFASCATYPERSESPVLPVLEEVTPKTIWLQNIQETLGQNLCAPNRLFRSCYEISESDCRERVRASEADCIAAIEPEIPETLSSEEGKAWGGEIGACTGDGLFQSIEAVYTANETESCNQLLSEF